MKHILGGVVTVLLAGIDLYLKQYVENEMRRGEEKFACKKRVVIRKVYNRGFALNLLENKQSIVKWISVGICGVIAGYAMNVWKTSKFLIEKLAVALVLAGGLSNTYERVRKHYVVDYFGFQTKNKKFNRITFNVGDMYVFLGGIVLMIMELVKEKR